MVVIAHCHLAMSTAPMVLLTVQWSLHTVGPSRLRVPLLDFVLRHSDLAHLFIKIGYHWWIRLTGWHQVRRGWRPYAVVLESAQRRLRGPCAPGRPRDALVHAGPGDRQPVRSHLASQPEGSSRPDPHV